MKRAACLVAALLTLYIGDAIGGALPALAQQSLPPAPFAYRQLSDPAQEMQAQELMETLRCLECQSQSIADSDAPMAGDMRHQVRVRIAAGETPEQVRGWLTARYGDYVSYAPQVSASTWPLFAFPALLVLIVAAVLWRRLAAGRADRSGSGRGKADKSGSGRGRR